MKKVHHVHRGRVFFNFNKQTVKEIKRIGRKQTDNAIVQNQFRINT